MKTKIVLMMLLAVLVPRLSMAMSRTDVAAMNFAAEIAQREDIRILEKLKNIGIKKIGGESIEKVLDRAFGTEFVVLKDEDIRFQNADGSLRTSAYWEIDSNGNQKIHHSLKEARLALGPEPRQIVRMHERLGPADRNFANSELLNLISKTSGLKNVNPNLLEKSLNMDTRDQQLKSGGTSGVSGGGDYRVQYYIHLIYFKLSRMMSPDQIDREQISLDQILNLTCFLSSKIDFDIDPQLAPGRFRSDLQNQPNGIRRIKIFFPAPKSFGSRDIEEYVRDYDQFVPTLTGLLSIFLEQSANACSSDIDLPIVSTESGQKP